MDEYTILEQVKIRLLHYKVSTIEGEDVVVFDYKRELVTRTTYKASEAKNQRNPKVSIELYR